MTKFQITLNFSCTVHSAEDTYDNRQMKARKEAFERTDAYYAEHNIVDYIKSFDAMSLVEYVVCDGEVLSAEWDPEKFQIHMVAWVDEADEEEIKDDLKMNSLEDGEYEGCGESGWLIFTRGPNGEVFDNPMGSEDFWEYALLDYRENPIVVKKMSAVV